MEDSPPQIRDSRDSFRDRLRSGDSRHALPFSHEYDSCLRSGPEHGKPGSHDRSTNAAGRLCNSTHHRGGHSTAAKKFCKDPRILVCVLLGILPIFILFGVSVATPIHIFVERYRLVAIPGIALFWGFATSVFESRALRLGFCVVFVGFTTYQYFTAPAAMSHSYTWKYAIDVAEKNASRDNAPVVICSDLPESDHVPMPVGAAIQFSTLFAPITYYKLSVPVVGLPRALNDEAKRSGSAFLGKVGHRRFLALAYEPSWDTIDWLAYETSDSHDIRDLGVFDGVKVVEFVPQP